jgi:NAD(P)-dependent dehydrogenase (short-subunit alcohol dehydrogenase family)
MGGTTVVVGATGELGAPIVARLAREGHQIVAVARNEAPLRSLASSHPGVSTFAANVAEEDDIRSLDSQLGDARLRMLVFLAAAPVASSVLDVRPAQILEAIDVKVNGLLRLVQILGHRLQPGSGVVAVGGVHGFRLGPDTCAAGLANACQAALVRQLSWAFEGRDVAFHSVAPGPVNTSRLSRRSEVEAQRRGVSPETVLDEAGAGSPFGRVASVDEIAWCVARLADPEAQVLNGSVLFADLGARNEVP